MGLFNKLFTKSHEPYELRGRWYKMRLSVNNDGFYFRSSDVPAVDASLYPNVPFGYAFNPEDPSVLDIFHGIVVDLKMVPLKGMVPSRSIEYEAEMSHLPTSSVYLDGLSLSRGDMVDLYLYIIIVNGLSG